MANHAMYGSNKYSEENNNVVLFSQDYGTAGATHTNSTDAADLFSYSIPANTLEVGDVVKIKVYATVTDNNSTDTLTPVLNFGGSAISSGAALDVADGDLVWCEAEVSVTAVGSAGTMTSYAKIFTDAGGSVSLMERTLLTSKDTTGALAIALNVDWSVADATNIVRLDKVHIEKLG